MNKPYNIQNTNICNGIFHISFFKALLINEGETGIVAKRPGTVFKSMCLRIKKNMNIYGNFEKS